MYCLEMNFVFPFWIRAMNQVKLKFLEVELVWLMQMQHFNHNVWEEHIISFSSITQKPVCDFSTTLPKWLSWVRSYRQEIQPGRSLLNWKTAEQMKKMELGILTTICLLARVVTWMFVRYLRFQVMIICRNRKACLRKSCWITESYFSSSSVAHSP